MSEFGHFSQGTNANAVYSSKYRTAVNWVEVELTKWMKKKKSINENDAIELHTLSK